MLASASDVCECVVVVVLVSLHSRLRIIVGSLSNPIVFISYFTKWRGWDHWGGKRFFLTIFLVAGILNFQPSRLGPYSIRTTASYSGEGIEAAALFEPLWAMTQINITCSHQLSTIYLFGKTSLRLTRERIENHLYIL